MTENAHQKRGILRATSVVGGATIATLAIGLIKMKAIALYVGPVGVGLMGTLSTLMALGLAVTGMAIDTSGIRLLSAANTHPAMLRVIRIALWSSAWFLASLAALLFWVLRRPLALWVTGDAGWAQWVGWIGIGVAISILSGVQLAIVQADRRLGDLARIKVVGACVAAAASVGAISLWGANGIIVAILAMPAATALIAWIFQPRAIKAAAPKINLKELTLHWRELYGLGLAVMLSALVGSFTQTSVRAIIVQNLGMEAAGLFQASFTISTLNLAIVLSAMAADYYPRLCAATDHRSKQSILDQQVHVSWILAAPPLLAISAFAPILLHLLYSHEFTAASQLLRFQLAADTLRIVGWAVGFVLLSRNARLAYFSVEVVLGIIYIPAAWLFVGKFGIGAVGAAYGVGYLGSMTLAASIAARRYNIRLSRRNWAGLARLVIPLILIICLAEVSELLAILSGTLFFLGSTYRSSRELAQLGVRLSPWPLSTLPARVRKRIGSQES